MVGGDLYGYLNHAVDSCRAANGRDWIGFGIVGCEGIDYELAARSSGEGAGESGIATGTGEVEFLRFREVLRAKRGGLLFVNLSHKKFLEPDKKPRQPSSSAFGQLMNLRIYH